ncbi:MAG: glycoside hydrolase family 71/99-like protein [Verrucomicrobiota bacterium]
MLLRQRIISRNFLSSLLLSIVCLVSESGVLLQADSQVDASTIHGKLMCGYQAWFRHPGDGSTPKGGIEKNRDRWVHWCSRQNPRNITVEMWPDMSEYSKKYDTGLKFNNGEPAYVFSSWDPAVFDLHFRWMKEYNIDGVYQQQFIGQLYEERDLHILKNVKKHCEKYGRVFALEYDVSGSAKNLPLVLKDWERIVEEGFTKSPSYLHHKGKPLLSIWGFGFTTRPYEADVAIDFINKLKNHQNPACRPTLIGGVPTAWRTLDRDSRSDPKWAEVYAMFDVISPWTVGRYGNQALADKHFKEYWEPDLKHLKKAGVEYLPIIFPGSCMANLKSTKGESVHNNFSRQGGHFIWRQAYNLIKGGAKTIKIAMFDEVDEATAIFKTTVTHDEVPNVNQFPLGKHPPGLFVTMQSDGFDIQSDHYLKVAGEINKSLDNPSTLSEVLPLEAPLLREATSKPDALIAIRPIRNTKIGEALKNGKTARMGKPPHSWYERAWKGENHVWRLEESQALHLQIGESYGNAVKNQLTVKVDFFADAGGVLGIEYLKSNQSRTKVEEEINGLKGGEQSLQFVLDGITCKRQLPGKTDLRIYRKDETKKFAAVDIKTLTFIRD